MLYLTISYNIFVLWWTCTPWLGAMLEHGNWILACDQMASDSELTLYYIKWITRYAENTLSYHTWMEFLKFQTDQRRVLKEETSGTLSWNYYIRNADEKTALSLVSPFPWTIPVIPQALIIASAVSSIFL